MIFLLVPALLFLPVVQPGDTCKTGKDKLTGRTVYVTYEVGPECEGGMHALMMSLNRTLHYPDSLVTDEIDTKYSVSFIVEVDGRISGGRIVHGSSKQLGNQILDAIKRCRWHPAKCNGKKIPALHTLSTIVELNEN